MSLQKRTQDDISKEFNVFSANYTEDMIKCVPHYLNLLQAFSQKYPSGFSPLHILDLGCGNGNVTAQLIDHYPKASYTLVDASETMLNLCHERFKNYDIKSVQSYFKDFELTPSQYHLIVAGFSLHHCEPDEKRFLFNKVYSALVPGGIFAISDLMINKDDKAHERVKTNWQKLVLSNYPDDEKWNWIMEHYAEFDRPDHFKDQIDWLIAEGFELYDLIKKDDYWVHLKVSKPK